MRKRTRITALLLAASIMVYGMPLFSASAQGQYFEGGAAAVLAAAVFDETEGAAPDTEGTVPDGAEAAGSGSTVQLADDGGPAEDPVELTSGEDVTTRMKFVMKDFDPATGLLTMTLKVKPSEEGRTEETAQGTFYTGTFISEGYFTFKTDIDTVEPVTSPADGCQPIAYGDAIGYVSSSLKIRNQLDAATNPGALGRRVGTKGYSATMDAHKYSSDGDFEESSTAYLVYAPPSGGGEGSRAEAYCYFHFRFGLDSVFPTAGPDGYVDISDFYFQCYAGFDPDTGDRLPAKDETALFINSIKVPQTNAEAQALTEKFYPRAQDDENGPGSRLSAGSAGWREKNASYFTLSSTGTTVQQGSQTGKGAWYYGEEPETPVWRTGNWGTATPFENLSTTNGNDTADAPGYYYPHMRDKYIVQGFMATVTNSFDADEIGEDSEGNILHPSDPDFYIPSGEDSSIQYRYPRFDVPTLEQEETQTGTAWSHADDPSKRKQVKLSYFFLSEVTSNSLIRPELEDPATFLNDIRWEFTFPDDDTPLNSYIDKVQVEEGAGTVENGMLVKRAIITEGHYKGCALQALYDPDDPATILSLTPVGVTLEMDPNSPIVFRDAKNEDVETTGTAPQFLVGSSAADPDSFLWRESPTTHSTGKFGLKAVYQNSSMSNGYEVVVSFIRFYMESRTPVSVSIDVSTLSEMDDPSGQAQYGFPVGIPYEGHTAKKEDEVYVKGLPITASMYDRYGFPVRGKSRCQLTLTPEGGEETAFEVAAKEPEIPEGLTAADVVANEYTIKYKGEDLEKKDVKDVVPGLYNLTATYGSFTDTEKIYVAKEADYLSHASVTFTGGTLNNNTSSPYYEAGWQLVDIKIPEAKKDGSPETRSLTTGLLELSNQWRDPTEAVGDLSVYDIKKGLRKNGALDLSLVRSNGIVVDFKAWFPDNVKDFQQEGVDLISDISNGVISFDSRAAFDGGTLIAYYTIDISYNGVHAPLQKFKLVFQRETLRLKDIKFVNPPRSAEVPSLSDGAKTVEISIIPVDQYGTDWNWFDAEKLYAPGGAWNQGSTPYDPWTLFSKVDLPTGVTLEENASGHAILLKLTPEAENTSVTLFGKFASVESSSSITIEIKRAASKPSTIQQVAYNTTRIIPPDASDPTGQAKATPQLIILDQYGEQLTYLTDYETVWDWKEPEPNTPSDQKKIHLDHSTGVVTADSCAPDVKLSLTVSIYDKENRLFRETSYDGLEVRRAAAVIREVTVLTESVDFPSLDAIGSGNRELVYLKATSSTQYGEGQDLWDNGPKDVSWMLDEVTFQDGSRVFVTYNEDGLPQFDGGITSSGGKYTGGCVTLSSNGLLEFSKPASEELSPVSMKVTATATKGSVPSASTSVAINMPDPHPSIVFVPLSVYGNDLSVPEVGQPEYVRTLTAYVRNQYGVTMAGRTVTWELSEDTPHQGVRIEGNNLYVDNTAQRGGFEAVASYTWNDGTKDVVISETVVFSIDRGDAKINKLEVTGFKEGSVDGLNLPLPWATGSSENYTLRCAGTDNYNFPMAASVSWEITDKPAGVKAEITDKYSGRMSISYSDEARDLANGGGCFVTVQATSLEDPSVKSAPVQVALVKAPATPAYAGVISAVIPVGSMNDSGQVKVPIRGEDPVHVAYTAQVYSQYKEPMEGEARMELESAEVSGQEFNMVGSNTGELIVYSSTSSNTARVIAYPVANPTGRESSLSYHTMILDRGTGYPYAILVDEESKDVTAKLPSWKTSETANVPSSASEKTFTLFAKVVDQYYAPYTTYQPKWEFVGDPPEGVSFADGGTTAEGELVTIVVNNTSLGSSLQQKVKLKLVCKQAPEDENFWAEATITLKRDPAVTSYLYYDGADEGGLVDLPRPLAEEGDKVFSLLPVVYDQYGIPLAGVNATLTVDIAGLRAQGLIVEQDEKSGNYLIWNEEGGPQTGVIDLAAGTITMNSACALKTLDVSAAVAGRQSKEARFVLTQEEVRPNSVEIIREQNEFVITGQENDSLHETVLAQVRDQYGARYTLPNVQARWYLMQEDEEGNLSEYKEYDEETGLEKPPAGYLLSKKDGSLSTSLTVQPENFEEDTMVILSCEIRKSTGGLFNPSIEGADSVAIVSQKDDKPSGVGTGYLYLTFEPGEYGQLVGLGTLEMPMGEKPKTLPGVKAEEGYGFIGWTVDGVNLIDPREMTIYGPMTFVAVYKDIRDTVFLDGYKDSTIRPNQAVTRAEFVKMLVMAMGGYEEEADYGPSFPDVKQGRWYANYIAFAKQQGLAGGYPDGTFRPDAPVTRAEAAKLVFQAMEGTVSEGSPFWDVPADAWYAGFVEALAEAGVLNGYEDGSFRASRDIKRSEAIKMIVSITRNLPRDLELENLQDFGYCPFIDVKRSHWAYAYILRAAGLG